MMTRNILFVLLLVGAAAAAVATRLPALMSQGDEDHSKYLKFSHALHVKDQGIACADCHTSAKESKFSSDDLLGTHASCQSCHEEQIANNCATCHTNPEQIVAIPSPSRELIFSHERHTTALSIECGTCHAGLEEATIASAKNMPAMTTCMTCHTAKKASINCETCHTNFTSLVPDDHRAGEFKKDHAKITRLGMQDVRCASCHREQFCQDCHVGDELKNFSGARERAVDPSPRASTKDSPKQLRVQQVHSLNYRYTHGIEAQSKTLDCGTCHQAQSFCAECHESGTITQFRIKPSTHNTAGFVTIGRGTGGGIHATMARRDLESCVTCHDVQGSDPVCATCHTEGGGIR